MANPLRITERAVDNLPHLSNVSHGRSLKGLVRNVGRRSKHFLSHGTPMGVAKRETKAWTTRAKADAAHHQAINMGSELASYRDSTAKLHRDLKRANSGSMAAAMYDSSGNYKAMPSAFKDSAEMEANRRYAMQKLRKTPGGRKAQKAFATHQENVTERYAKRLANQNQTASRLRGHAGRHANLAQDALDNSARNGVIAGSATALGTGVGVGLAQRAKKKKQLSDATFTRQKLR